MLEKIKSWKIWVPLVFLFGILVSIVLLIIGKKNSSDLDKLKDKQRELDQEHKIDVAVNTEKLKQADQKAIQSEEVIKKEEKAILDDVKKATSSDDELLKAIGKM